MQGKNTSGTHDMKAIMNRRAFPRLTLPHEIRFGQAREMVAAEPLEIGEGGLSFSSDMALPLESLSNVEFRLQPGDEWIKVRCVVRHSNKEKLGLEFLNLRMSDRLKIVDFMMAKH